MQTSWLKSFSRLLITRPIPHPFPPPHRFFSMSSASPLAKKARTDKVIGTHSGTFHADEALATFLLRLLPEYKDAALVRSRDPKALDECTIVVDVGGVYDPDALRFDHHQRGFEENFGMGFVTKLSSAGLVYK